MEILQVKGSTIFKDVDSNSWQSKVIAKATNLWIIHWNIDSDGNKVFRPNDYITRAEALKILMNMSQMNVEGSITTYTDITEENWFNKYVANAEALWVINAENDGYIFLPQSEISRENMVHMITNIAKLYRWNKTQGTWKKVGTSTIQSFLDIF